MKPLSLLLGRPLPSSEEGDQKIGVSAGIPMFGLDALASSAYGPEAALTVLIPLGAAGLNYTLPIFVLVLGLLLVLFLSYRQTIDAYPGGGGSYTVAKENLGERLGLLAAAALLLDYLLVVAVGIAAGVGALVSAFPGLNGMLVPLCLGILAFLVIVNLRGVRESGFAFLVPTWIFLGSLGLLILVGIWRAIAEGGAPKAAVAPLPFFPSANGSASVPLLLFALASGLTALTGVEAVSNGMEAFAEPRVKTAQRTQTTIVVLLAALLFGLASLIKVYGVGAAVPGSRQYQSVISQLAGAIAGRGVLYYTVVLSTLAILALSANSAFAAFPRLCRLLADDGYLPHPFAHRGRRLVYSRGIVGLAIMAGVLLVVFGGITDRLIPLFAIGAFLAFTLSQAGMVMHWRRERKAPLKVAVNAFGALCTLAATLVIFVARFTGGTWILLVLFPLFLALFTGVRRHYARVRRAIVDPGPVEITAVPPLVVLPIRGYDAVTKTAIEFALSLSSEIEAVHIALQKEDVSAVESDWERFVAAPFREAGRPAPEFRVIRSPLRRLSHPLVRHLQLRLSENPERRIAVVVPELVEGHWWQFLLHNGRATSLRAALLLGGERRIAIVSAPWYMAASKPTSPTDS